MGASDALHASLGGNMVNYWVNNPVYLLHLAIGHIKLSAISVAIAIVIALPIGAWVGHLHKFSFVAVNGSNVLRALPTLALIALGLSVYGFGYINITVALVILALPLIMTNSYVAVDQVDPATVQAARGMGMNGFQILWQVELPNSIPLIMAGVRVSWIYVVATAYLAGIDAVNGTLGDIIATLGSTALGPVLAAAAVSMAIAFAGDFVLAAAERAMTPRGLRIASPVAAAA
jgi:osmoprotectant transport system permease protein